MARRLAILLSFLMVSPAFGQGTISNSQTSRNRITVDDVIQKDGMILSLTHMKSGKIKMKFQSDETQEYTLDWKTMIYKLTERNKQIYKEQDKLGDIVGDANKLKQRVREIPNNEIDLLAHSWTSIWVSPVYRTGNVVWRDAYVHNHVDRNALAKLSKAWKDYWADEEDRQNMYGPSVKLVPRMTALMVADKGQDVTYAVLVTGKKEEPKPEKPVASPGQDRENEAARKLRRAKETLRDAEKAKGEERDRLSDIAQKKLQEIVDKYEGSKAAKEAQDILDGK
jgi:hypothetical protein